MPLDITPLKDLNIAQVAQLENILLAVQGLVLPAKLAHIHLQLLGPAHIALLENIL